MKVGQRVFVKNNNLEATDKSHGMCDPMREMMGKEYKIEKIEDHGYLLDNYWFNEKDIGVIKPKKPQIVHFNVDDLVT